MAKTPKKTTTKKKSSVKKAASKTTRKAPVKKAAKKSIAKKKPAKKAPAKKAPAKKPAAKKASGKKAPSGKKAARKAPAKKSAVKKAPSGKKRATGKTKAKAPAEKAAKKAPKKTKTTRGKTADSELSEKARAFLNSKATREKNATPILFSFDDATALLASRKKAETPKEPAPAPTPAKQTRKTVEVEAQPEKKRVHAAASLMDILGFDPTKKKTETELEENSVPAKWKKYYRLLIELRQHVKDELDLHTADTLKHSNRDDSGDLSGYGLHQADAGTDNFDRDFALSLVSNEQDALYEIEEAIQRIKAGTYGVCEVTGRKIDAKRLSAVPFTRFSVEGQSEYEKNKRRKIDRGGTAFAESGDLPTLPSDDGDD